ncbi:sulfotransferase [Paracoccus spongiarum]|uniref:Sulfotransferase n=1 Tax=Paracoccus spongiarum TaxID=3064387 RepID=A0ABT9JCA2_9RHOB|nr:sulfotransferase [Paracoccus sp. 2205BS29-5]MDP5307432.1 sulfotransferase [Paracoccus sp. 2205BS29-5]
MASKVFVIGFNKCGTTSLTQLFRKSGHAAIHCRYQVAKGQKANLAEQMFLNRSAGNPLLRGIDGRVMYSDMESNTQHWYLAAFTLFPELDAQYPRSRFILNLRDRAKWLRSRTHHNNGTYMRKFLASSGLASEDEVRALWARQWDTHLANVRAYFADKPGKLVEFDIAEDPIEKICDFLPDLKLDPAHWGKFNANAALEEPAA